MGVCMKLILSYSVFRPPAKGSSRLYFRCRRGEATVTTKRCAVCQSGYWTQQNEHGSDDRACLRMGWRLNHVASVNAGSEILMSTFVDKVASGPRTSGYERHTCEPCPRWIQMTKPLVDRSAKLCSKPNVRAEAQHGSAEQAIGLCEDPLERHTCPCPRRLPTMKTNTTLVSSS